MTSKLPHDVQHPYPVIEYGAADGWNPPRWDEEADTFIDRDEVSDPLEIATDDSEDQPLLPQTPGPQSDFYMQTFERIDNEFNAPGQNPYRDDGGLYRSGAEMTLRKRVIRLAHAKPELRPKLLPLLKTAEAPRLTRDEVDYFSGGKGHGRHVMNAWRKGELPAWGHFQGLMAWLRQIEALKEDPSWGSDEKSLRDLKGLIAKMDAYEKEVFPHGKPKKVRPKKQTRMGLFTEFMESSEGRKIRDLAKKLARNFDDIGAAGTFLEQVSEDANFRGGWKAVGRVVPSSGAEVTGVDPQDVAKKLRWEIESVAAFSVALVASLGKAAMAKKLMKAFLAEEDFLFEVTT